MFGYDELYFFVVILLYESVFCFQMLQVFFFQVQEYCLNIAKNCKNVVHITNFEYCNICIVGRVWKKRKKKSRAYVRDPKRTCTHSQSAYTVGLSQTCYIEEIPKYRSSIVDSCTSNPRPFLQVLVINFFNIFCGAFAYNWSICCLFTRRSVGCTEKQTKGSQLFLALTLRNYRKINAIRVKHAHCKGLLKMHVGLVLASSLASGGSLSEPPSLVCRRQQ